MTRLGRAGDGRFRRHAGLTLLLAGLFFVAAGLWGTLGGALDAAGAPTPEVLAGATSALLVPGVLLALHRAGGERVVRVGAGGAALTLFGTAIGVPSATRPVGAALYVAGVVVLVSSLVAADRVSDGKTVAWRASENDAEPRPAPADGGTEETDLYFPTDGDDENA